jgi:flagellar basal body-associated protein FliL
MVGGQVHGPQKERKKERKQERKKGRKRRIIIIIIIIIRNGDLTMRHSSWLQSEIL